MRGVERQERKFLEAIRRQLERDVKSIERLLRQAKAPRIAGDAQVARRVEFILAKIKKMGGRVTKAQLGEIVAGAGMSPTSVGSLYGAGYLKTDPSDKKRAVLGDKRPRTTDRKRPA